ncbi:hypothetical protein [Rhodococcus oryzae]|uniref:hypothetical protein n=1 Tax=Rhodococcus oryzae TaxID=2571143 RepID=UPI0037B44210
MTTFIALVLLAIVLLGVFVAVARRDPASGSVNVVDRDAERMFADLQAVRHRAPHS